MSDQIDGDLHDDKTPTMEAIEQKFVLKEVCSIMKSSLDTAIVDIGEMKETMASMAAWMKLHHETHAGGWKKAQTVAVVISTVIASISLIGTTILAVVTIIRLKP